MTRVLRLPLAVEAPRFASVRALEESLLAGVVPRLMLSANAKTSFSLDFPVGHTCEPTRLCAATCYATRPGTPALWPKSIRRRLGNWLAVRSMPTGEVVDELRRQFRTLAARYRLRGVRVAHLRLCGTGDLFAELVPVIDAFAAARPDVAVWVVTRRFELAEQLAQEPNLYLQLSIDRTTMPLDLARARRIVAENPRAYLSFLRTRPDDDVRGAAIVFNEKRTADLPYRSKTDCPADAGALELGNVKGQGGTACASCRKCFDERTLARQRGAAAELAP